MEDRLIELEALQKGLLKGTETFDKMQAELIKARESLTRIFTSKDVKATLLEMVETNELNRSLLTLLDENIASANRSNQDISTGQTISGERNCSIHGKASWGYVQVHHSQTFSLEANTVKSAAATANPTTSNFIKASCRATRYPALCIQCLSAYARSIQKSDHQLANAALSVSLVRARSTAMFVSRMTKFSGIKSREYRAVKDCVENMAETVDQLSKSIQELRNMGRSHGQDFLWHMSNVQTWVSAALTNENTCVDGFAGSFMEGNVKALIKTRVVSVAQVTSNALALVNRFAVRHKASEITKKP